MFRLLHSEGRSSASTPRLSADSRTRLAADLLEQRRDDRVRGAVERARRERRRKRRQHVMCCVAEDLQLEHLVVGRPLTPSQLVSFRKLIFAPRILTTSPARDPQSEGLYGRAPHAKLIAMRTPFSPALPSPDSLLRVGGEWCVNTLFTRTR